MTEEKIKCSKCSYASVSVSIEPDEKPDGTILGYATATCPECGYHFDEDEILEIGYSE
jgi:C4-type Zn-finger protein